jgi:hypothetical protein
MLADDTYMITDESNITIIEYDNLHEIMKNKDRKHQYLHYYFLIKKKFKSIIDSTTFIIGKIIKMNDSYITVLVICCNDTNIDCKPFTQKVKKDKIDAIYFSASLANLKTIIMKEPTRLLSQYQDNCLYFLSRKSKGGKMTKKLNRRNKTQKKQKAKK